MYLPLLEPNAGFYSLCLELDGVFSLGKKINKVAKLTKVPLVIPNYHQPNRGYALVACTHACVLPGSNKLLSSSIKSML